MHDAMIMSYEFNNEEPRFFSKIMAKSDPLLYDVALSDAVGGSSAAPGYFDPKTYYNKVLKFKQYFIDGAIICNNPAMYAFEFAQ